MNPAMMAHPGFETAEGVPLSPIPRYGMCGSHVKRPPLRSRRAFLMNRLPTEVRAKALEMLVEGSSMRSVSRVLGISRSSVATLLVRGGTVSQIFHDHIVREVRSTRIEADEIWSFCYTRERHDTEPIEVDGIGTVWTWTAIDPDSKLMVSWLVGNHETESATEFMQDLQSRLANRVQLTTDGFKPYLDAVADTFGRSIDYAMVVRVADPNTDRSKQKEDDDRVIGKKSKITIFGHPDLEGATTNHVERQNLTMRMSIKRYTRQTNAFSKKFENHRHAVALFYFYYNFCRRHLTIGRTPAEEAGLSAYPLTMRNLVDWIDQATPAPRRKPYGPRRN